MLENYPLEHLQNHLIENHDEDWVFESVYQDGLALRCYLPTDTPETYFIVDSNYDIIKKGTGIPKGLLDEVNTTLQDGLKIYLNWQDTDLPEKWA